MDAFDLLKVAPLAPNRFIRYSVGCYKGRKRIVVAWFEDESRAVAYREYLAGRFPRLRFDYLRTLF